MPGWMNHIIVRGKVQTPLLVKEPIMKIQEAGVKEGLM